MKEFDYIIIGGGSAGWVLAARLSEDPDISVLLLEAGGSDRSFLFHWPAGFSKMTKGIASWGWSTVHQRHMKDRQIWFTQAKVIGGGSTINAQVYTRGNRMDYDGWSEDHGCAGWSYQEVLPYFKRAESNERFNNEYHGIRGPLGVSMPRAALPVCDAFLRAAQEYGIPYNPDFNGALQDGVGFYQLTQRDARRSSAAVAFLKPAESRPNLTVLLNAQATRIAIDQSRAKGVEILRKNKEEFFRASREVILASRTPARPLLPEIGDGFGLLRYARIRQSIGDAQAKIIQRKEPRLRHQTSADKREHPAIRVGSRRP